MCWYKVNFELLKPFEWFQELSLLAEKTIFM